MRKFAAWFVKQTTPIAQCLAWRRLGSTIASYRRELEGRAEKNAALKPGLSAILAALDDAAVAQEFGQIDLGWKIFFVAQRLELFYLDPAELNAAAAMIRHEADKLSGWRKASVIELLTVKEKENVPLDKVFRAALIRDEHFNNQAYKDGLRRGGALRLAIVLVAVLLGIFYLGHAGYILEITSKFGMPDSQAPFDADSHFKWLMTVAVFGLLGATVSAITKVPEESSTRIPEMIATIRFTVLRLLMGPASAIVIYFVIQSKLYKAVFSLGQPDGWGLLIIVFVAGFTERLVLRVVEVVAGNPSK